MQLYKFHFLSHIHNISNNYIDLVLYLIPFIILLYYLLYVSYTRKMLSML